ncbi:MAG: valine--tRNA ligase, partial [Gammaproteobacteria bacterium]|nr:valine--tRNA ligase [Gammaproteobacteria bacterium]
PVSGSSNFVVVATTRPETMLGDTAVAVHPDDERYRDLIGKTIELPLCDRKIPVIADEYVDPEFGSGCVKITPAHDFNDYEVGLRHALPMINIFTEDARINDDAPEAYRGMARFDARKKIIADLETLELLEKTEAHKLKVPRGDRSGDVVEPYLTDQWYVRAEPLARPAIAAVENGDIRFVPENWSKTYFEWMHNIQDWCISRQLWWGHRIPAWYDEDGNCYVARNEEEARARNGLGKEIKLVQDEDVLDTWFSSALWPFSTLGWPQQSDALKTFYPTTVLVTGFDIIFFWVARMIMMGLKFTGKIPFAEVYIHGLIRDEDGHKMSKAKGNVLDPLDLIDGIELEALVEKRTANMMQPRLQKRVEKATRKQFKNGIPAYGTDALRFTYASLATTGRDIRFDMGRIEGYRNFCNKLWNASRYVLLNTETISLDGPVEYSLADRWIRSRLSVAISSAKENFDQYRFDLAARALYEFTWHEFCDWYLELSKPVLHDESASPALQNGARRTLASCLEALLRALHPLMPYITEEIWRRVAPIAQRNGTTIMLQAYPRASDFDRDTAADEEVAWIKSFILGVRQIRGEMDISPAKPIPVLLQDWHADDRSKLEDHRLYLQSLARIAELRLLGAEEEAPPSATALQGSMKILVPMAGLIDPVAELTRLQRRRDKTEKDLSVSEKKLQNPNFVDNAPAEIVAELRDRVQKLQTLLGQIETQITRVRELGDDNSPDR